MAQLTNITQNTLHHFLLGDTDNLLIALISFVVIDYATGVCVAIHEHRLSSGIGAKGIARKVAVFLMVAMSNIADQFLMDSGHLVRTVTISFYIVNEGISIFENVSKLGVPLPDKLTKVLDYFNQINQRK